jgi:hypothetical protein
MTAIPARVVGRRLTTLITATILAMTACAPGMIHAQRYRPPPRPPQLEGNWIKQQSVPNPNYGKPLPGKDPYAGRYDMRETINKNRVDGDAILRDIGRSLRYDIESWNYRNQYRPPAQPSRPPAQPSRPQIVPAPQQFIPSQPQVVERMSPQPVSVVESVSPPRNVIPTAAPQPNADFSAAVLRAVREHGSAQTDAGQILIAQDTVKEINESLGVRIEMSGSEAMRKAWKEATADGSAKAMADFEMQFGDELAAIDPAAARHLDLSVRFGAVAANLQDCLLTGDGKRRAIDDLMAEVAALAANDPLREGLVEDLKQMRQLQQLGELMDLAALEPQPLVPVFTGLDEAKIPLDEFTAFLGLPVMTGPAESMASPASAAGLRLINPASTGAEVRFSVGGKPENMPAGSELGLSGTASVIFDPGNGQYRGVSITSGTWEWRRDDGLWSLRKEQPEITLENPGFDGVFRYTVNGRPASLERGASATHADPLPLTIAFDRGDGGTPVTKVLSKGVYVVAIDAASKWLDLFRTDAEPPVQAGDAAVPVPASKGEQIRKSLADPGQRQKMNALIEALRSSR